VNENPSRVVSPFDNPVQFGFGIASNVDTHLQRAAQLVASREASLAALNDAYQEAPDQVETLVAMFKLLFYQGETDKAKALVEEALSKAACQGGFASDWRTLEQDSADWTDPRGAGRLYLYSLKALAFIRLRQDDLVAAREILQAMRRIDPDDQVGADVIRELLEGVEGECDDG
jgi:tetratricopeptide (TPR) repeat protein